MWQLVLCISMQSSPSDFPLKEGTGFSKIQSPALPEQAEGVEHPAGFSPGSADLSELPVPIHLLMSIPAVLGVLSLGSAGSVWSLHSAWSIAYIWYVFHAKWVF